ncbi:MAG: CobW family GTP-binding protein [Candidatus Korobacteraceae bacterium]
MTQLPAIPVTIIGGYLGAGKTTLLNSLLRGDHGMRLAILVNDFGSINIDAALIASHRGETVSLTNGCVCCNMADNLAIALLELLGRDIPPDHIVIEASGVADPGKVASYGAAHPRLRLDSLIVVADAETVRARSVDKYVGELVVRQLVAADLVVLSKLDLIDESNRVCVRNFLRETVPHATLLEACHGLLPWDLLLGVGATPSQTKVAPYSRRGGPAPKQESPSFSRASFENERPFDRGRLREILEALPESVIRVKGVVYVAGEGSHSFVLQKVGRHWTLEAGSPCERGARLSQLIMIGTWGPADIPHLIEGFRWALTDELVATP